MRKWLTWLDRKNAAFWRFVGNEGPPPPPPRPATLEDAVLAALDLKIRAMSSVKALAEFELAYLAVHEEALGMVPVENLASLRASSLERDDSQGRAMAVYIDGLLAARLVPAAH